MRYFEIRVLAAIAVASASVVGSAGRSEAQAASNPAPNPVYVARARADSARYPYTVADIQFLQGMIHHHAQALVMARMAPSHGARPSVLTLCARIINAQNDEIALMSQWLRDRNQDAPAPTPGPMKMKMGGMEHDVLMPGMLSEAQMKALDEARGADFDRKFLEGMIQHHSGAVQMVDELSSTFGAAQDLVVQKLSQDIHVDQTTEIARMRKMLAEVVLGVSLP